MKDIFKKSVLLLIIIISTFSLTACNKNKENDTSTKEKISQKSSIDTSKILEYYKQRIADLKDDKHQYSVIDINNDGIPELFTYTTGTIGNEIIANNSIYTYDENKGSKDNNYIVNIGMLAGRIDVNTVFYKMNDGTLLTVFGHMGYEITSRYTLENDWLVRTDLTYKETDDYIKGDIEIKFLPCSDTSLIDNYK